MDEVDEGEVYEWMDAQLSSHTEGSDAMREADEKSWMLMGLDIISQSSPPLQDNRPRVNDLLATIKALKTPGKEDPH